MISAEIIRKIAREQGIGAAVAEKDYALTWLLKGVFANESQLRETLVLKGGTAIRKVYFPETRRFSEDLDFTTTTTVVGYEGTKKNRDDLQAILDKLTRESGIEYSLDSHHANPGAIIASVRFRGPLGHPNRIRLDISLTEKMALEPEWHSVRSDFQDLHSFKIRAYSLKEIVAEKIRSIMQRGYSRDYYDVWRLVKEHKFDDVEIKKLVMQKCEMKGIEYRPELLFDVIRLEEAKAHWVVGLGHLVKELPDFNAVISELRLLLAFLL